MSTGETEDLRVGIIGVSAERGWARDSHVPAVHAVPGLTLLAVASRDQKSAAAAAAASGAERAYGDATALVNDPDVDVVTVAAPVPAHRDLILAALQAGKHVVTEWPVGTGTAQTEEIALAARASGLRTAIGLQARVSPAAVRAAELVAAGAIGRVLHATTYATTAGFGLRVAAADLSLEDPETGMNLTTIQTAHTLDIALMLAGSLNCISALTTVQYRHLQVTDADGSGPLIYERTLPDHVLAHGRLDGGGALAVQVVGGFPADDTPFRLTVVGERGALELTGGAPRGFQSGRLELSVDGRRVDTSDEDTVGLPDAVVNVAQLYAALRDDIGTGTTTAPDFGRAVRLSHLVDDLILSAARAAP